jgi:hypothetical protein
MASIMVRATDSPGKGCGANSEAYRKAAFGILNEVGQREPGHDGWADEVIARATAFARGKPTECRDDLDRHFWPLIAQHTGESAAGLAARARRQPGSGGELRHHQANRQANAPEARQGGFRFDAIDSATFAAKDYRPTWLVQGLTVAMQPLVVGGPRKALKTSLLVDYVISLGSATPFLGRFKVYRRVRTALVSGESGEFTLQETARRVSGASGLWGCTNTQLCCVLPHNF